MSASRHRARLGWAIACAAIALGCNSSRSSAPAPIASGPLAAPPPAGVHAVEVAVSVRTTYARMSDGTVRAWGCDQMGALGRGTELQDVATPVRVLGVDDATALYAADDLYTAACVRRGDGRVACWGAGSLIPGPGDGPHTPTDVPSLRGARHIELGPWYGCALLADERIACWGRAPGEAQRDSREENDDLPRLVPGLDQVVALRSSSQAACAVRRDGKVFCWGLDDGGQVSPAAHRASPAARRDSPAAPKGELIATPREIPGVTDAVDVSLAGSLACARLRGGGLACWGKTFAGAGVVRLAAPDPAPLFALNGGLAVCERDVLGAVRCLSSLARADCFSVRTLEEARRCGAGDLGYAPDRAPWTAMGALPPVRQLALGLDGGCAVTAGGQVVCWGKNEHGQLGDGTLAGREMPAPVVDLVVPRDPPEDGARTLRDEGPAQRFEELPAACKPDRALELREPGLDEGPFEVRSAWAKVDDYGIEVVLRDHGISEADAFHGPVSGPRRLVSVHFRQMSAKGEFERAKPGTYRPSAELGPAGGARRELYGVVRARHVYHDFAGEKPELRGKAELRAVDGRWICGEVDLRAEGRVLRGAFAAERVRAR